MHPVTWFKIEFPDGEVHTFRPSALQISNFKSTVEKESSATEKKSGAQKKARTDAVDLARIKITAAPSQIDADSTSDIHLAWIICIDIMY